MGRACVPEHARGAERVSGKSVNGPPEGGPYEQSGVAPYKRSGDRDLRREVDVLDRVEQRHAFLHRALERLTARDETHPAGALVDDGRPHGFLEIAFT